jgi:16S rRNA processing protein RimM
MGGLKLIFVFLKPLFARGFVFYQTGEFDPERKSIRFAMLTQDIHLFNYGHGPCFESRRMQLNLDNYIQIGEIYREHGIKGYVKVFVYSATDENLEQGLTYILKAEDGATLKTKLEDVSSVGRYFLLKFDAFKNPEDILAWRKAGVFLEKNQLMRDDGEVYDYEWENVSAFDNSKTEIGLIRRIAYMPLKQFILETPTNPELIIPYNPDWIVKFDSNAKTVILDLPEGLVDL